MITKNIKVEKIARYYISREISSEIKQVWIVCHGYAQLAVDFIMDFEPLFEDSTLVVAPEGLSRFYTKGFFGKPGATWMTKEDRLNEIDDYVNYLQKLYELVKNQVDKQAEFHILGFSQGCATACRWINFRQPEFSTLWICSGEVPPDLDWEIFSKQSKRYDFKLLYGTKDPFLKNDTIENLQNRLAENNVAVATHKFNGAHVIDVEFIKSLL